MHLEVASSKEENDAQCKESEKQCQGSGKQDLAESDRQHQDLIDSRIPFSSASNSNSSLALGNDKNKHVAQL